VVSLYGLDVDRIIVREGRARENTRCSLVDREDHLILCRLTTEDTTSGGASLIITHCKLFKALPYFITLFSFPSTAVNIKHVFLQRDLILKKN
jgi:hypothetical protein